MAYPAPSDRDLAPHSAALLCIVSLVLTSKLVRLRVLQGVAFAVINQAALAVGSVMFGVGVYVTVETGAQAISALVKLSLGVGLYLVLLGVVGLVAGWLRHPPTLYVHCFMATLMFGLLAYGVYYAINQANHASSVISNMTDLEIEVRQQWERDRGGSSVCAHECVLYRLPVL